MKATSDAGYYMRRSGAPVTLALIASFVGIFVISWLMKGTVAAPLAFLTDWSQPWGIVTYAWASSGDGQGLFWFLLEMYWLWWVGSAAEVQLGTKKYIGFFLASIVLAGLFLYLGLMLVYPRGHIPNSDIPLAVGGGPGLAIAALTVAWGVRNPRDHIMLMFVIPVPGLILAWLTVALTLFGYGSMYGAPLVGLFAILHLGLVYLFATNRIPGVSFNKAPIATSSVRPNEAFLKKTEKMDKSYYDDVKRREKEREERDRLRKLFEDSMKDDEGK